MLHGQHLIRSVYEMLRANQEIWNKTMLIVTYDEHGGFFDHVPPAVAEVLQDPRKVLATGTVGTPTRGGGGVGNPVPGSQLAFRPNEEVIYGVRVPTFIISPWVDKGAVMKRVVDHASILKTILVRFCASDRPFLSDRVHHAFDLGSVLTEPAPRNILKRPPELPTLPDSGVHALAKAFRIIRKREITANGSDWHDFMEALARMVRH
jgi:phospholipase C